jgi:hypothetical protein
VQPDNFEYIFISLNIYVDIKLWCGILNLVNNYASAMPGRFAFWACLEPIRFLKALKFVVLEVGVVCLGVFGVCG